MQHGACSLGGGVFSRLSCAVARCADSICRYRVGNTVIPDRGTLWGRWVYRHDNSGHQCVLHGDGVVYLLLVVHGDTFVLLSPEVATISSFLRASDGRSVGAGRAGSVHNSPLYYRDGLLLYLSGCRSRGTHAADRVFLPAETQVM